MSFIFKVERPQHIKYGYGYYIRFEDDSFLEQKYFSEDDDMLIL